MPRTAVSKEKFWTNELISLNAGALASNTAVSANTKIDGSRLQGCLLDKMRYLPEIIGKTADQGPLMWGISVGLTVAEIAEAVIADPQHHGETPEWEQITRKVMPVGWIGFQTTDRPAQPDDDTKSFRSKRVPPWNIFEGEGVNIWLFNWGSTLTTGMQLSMVLGLRQRWLSD